MNPKHVSMTLVAGIVVGLVLVAGMGRVTAAPVLPQATSLRLPFTQSVNHWRPAFEIQNSGNGAGIRGFSAAGIGVTGGSFTHDGVQGSTGHSQRSGVYGVNTGDGFGVYGQAGGKGPAVMGKHTGTGFGVVATSQGDGLLAQGGNRGAWITGAFGDGLHVDGGKDGIETSTSAQYKSGTYSRHLGGNYGNGVFGAADVGVGIYGWVGSGWAGYFDGNVRVVGGLSVTGAKNFVIDDPRDPANKYLYHASVESPDMKNIYDGVVTTDARGDATVLLPTYFEAINRDFRYQLTVVGQFAQAIVAKEIKNNRFTIKTDKPNVKVSWQVTGIRNDAYAQANPMQVEVTKPAAERGTYLAPEVFGQPASKGVQYEAVRQATAKDRPANLNIPQNATDTPQP